MSIDQTEGYANLTTAGGTYLKIPLLSINGYDERLERGEETELGIRFVNAGYKIWRTTHIVGFHDYGVKSFIDLVKRDIATGRSTANNAFVKGEGDYFLLCKKTIRRQFVKFILFLSLFACSIIISNYFYLIVISMLVFIFQNRGIFWKTDRRQAGIIYIKILYNLIGQLFYYYGLISTTFRTLFRTKILKVFLREKEILATKIES